jgi:hypothetical protein
VQMRFWQASRCFVKAGEDADVTIYVKRSDVEMNVCFWVMLLRTPDFG